MPPQFISVCTDGMGVTPAEPVARHVWMLIRSERALMAENAQQVPQYVGMCWRGEEAAAFEVLSRHCTQWSWSLHTWFWAGLASEIVPFTLRQSHAEGSSPTYS
jgi:hypothetical protein